MTRIPPSDSALEIENTYYRKVSKGSQTAISYNESKQENKNKNLPDDVKKTVKNRRKEMLEKLSYSPQSLKSICAKEFSYVASSHLAWYK